MLTIAETYGKEMQAVRVAMMAVDNAVEQYLTDDLDEAYESVSDAQFALGSLMEASHDFVEILRKRAVELEEMP